MTGRATGLTWDSRVRPEEAKRSAMWLQHDHGHRSRRRGAGHWRASARWLGLASLAALVGTAFDAEAASSRGKGAKARAKRSSQPAPTRGGGGEAALADANIAVLAFEGEESERLRKHVIKVFVERGMRVNSTLKAQDNPTQYRDMGAALDLAAYVHGKIRDTGPEKAVATVTIRSAVTGRPLTSATFNGFRRGLPFDVEEKLWDRVLPALKRACLEAQRPGRRHSKPLHINAGTPL